MRRWAVWVGVVLVLATAAGVLWAWTHPVEMTSRLPRAVPAQPILNPPETAVAPNAKAPSPPIVAAQPKVPTQPLYISAKPPQPRPSKGVYGTDAGIPILMFHRFNYDFKNKNAITPEAFEAVLQGLKAENYCLVDLNNYIADRFDPACVGRKLVALTFDDGHFSQVAFRRGAAIGDTTEEQVAALEPTSGLAVLLKVFPQAKATFFLNTHNGGAPFGYDSATKVELLRQLGLTIGNHTISHANLSRSSTWKIQREIEGVCQYFGMKTMLLAYPYGLGNLSKPVNSYLNNCSISAAFDASLGYYELSRNIPHPLLAPVPSAAQFAQLRYHLPRINIRSLEDLQRDVLDNPGVYKLEPTEEAGARAARG